ncbi:AAA family ATPase [Nitrogeniibacter mangrovi]|uniref:AAA family ATPase n=1 Tax=Nitrogeniibacter mangrovi TaxID=2016596 RepID=A0A6C1AYZ1_9RHOO|nr:AAA family ATPase [Nitrogeniibacter mangrovi]QID16566.1 AAA family ATPase [Nitrogeniibacter mangrovi]
MYVNSIEMENYKCFLKPQEILLAPGFNLFVGANNSGKTTALEALDLDSTISSPHRSVANLPEYGASPSPHSRLKLSLTTTLNEYRGISTTNIQIPIPNEILKNISSHGNVAARQLYDGICESPEIVIFIEIHGGNIRTAYKTCHGFSKIVNSKSNNDTICSIYMDFNPSDGTLQNAQVANSGGIERHLASIREKYRSRIYRFSAQRLPADTSSTAGDPVLQRNAGNLPYCINHLHSNDAEGHRILCNWVHRIFPSVKWIQAPPIPGNQAFQLQCLPEAPSKRRHDLAVSLDKMGSGIGNVIAILYVVLTSRFPQVIAIDEPNSFLHPKALRELLGILSQEGKQHQYILTAHSPDVLTAVSPATITMFSLNETYSVTKQVSGKDLPSLRTDLAHLGIRMTDLHGQDRVLWVEGQTEEIVIPVLLRHFCPEVAAGTAVLRVEHTGAFEKKGLSPTEVAKIYQRLTASSALVPPMVAILLDKENRKSSECKKICQESSGAIHFLERKMLENYVLHPDAISAVLTELGEPIASDTVRAELDSYSYENLASANGSEVLSNIFSKLSEARLEFRKTRDTPSLIDWLLANQPSALVDLEDFLRRLFGLPLRAH